MRAPVNIFGVPEAHDGTYHIRDWLRTPLFSCMIAINDNAVVGRRLPVRLEKNGNFIAQCLYSAMPGRSGIAPVNGSSKHFVITLENGSLRALVGIALIDRSDAIDFSFLLHDFARRYTQEPQETISRRRPQQLAGGDKTSSAKPAPPLAAPPGNEGTDSSSNEEEGSDSSFGEFQ